MFLGGDVLPHAFDPNGRDELVRETFEQLRDGLGEHFPQVFLILGNDDPRVEEKAMLKGEAAGLWTYVHGRNFPLGRHTVFGYACVPPTPFHLKDWSAMTSPGTWTGLRLSGRRAVVIGSGPEHAVRRRTIEGRPGVSGGRPT